MFARPLFYFVGALIAAAVVYWDAKRCKYKSPYPYLFALATLLLPLIAVPIYVLILRNLKMVVVRMESRLSEIQEGPLNVVCSKCGHDNTRLAAVCAECGNQLQLNQPFPNTPKSRNLQQ